MVGVRLYPSKLSLLSPINFSIYTKLPGNCTYKFVKCYALKFASFGEEVVVSVCFIYDSTVYPVGAIVLLNIRFYPIYCVEYFTDRCVYYF